MANGKKLRILVVDDLELSRREVARFLTNLGYESVEQATDGLQALDLLAKAAEAGQPFQVVLCDWNMPNVSGLDVLKTCRSEASLKSPGFIMVTAEAGMAQVMEALNLGANDYIIKPVTSEVLQKKVDRLVARLGY